MKYPRIEIFSNFLRMVDGFRKLENIYEKFEKYQQMNNFLDEESHIFD